MYQLAILLSKLSIFIFMFGIYSCYFDYITGGYIPTFQFSKQAQIIIFDVFFGMMFIGVALVYIYELLMSVAYLTVCVSIVVKYISNLKRQKRAQKSVTRMVGEYHEDLQAYRN